MKKLKLTALIVVLAAALLIANQAFGTLTIQPAEAGEGSNSNYSYVITVEGIEDFGNVQSITGLNASTEIVEYKEGEDIRKRPARTKYANIVIKRRYLSSDTDPVYLWCKSVLDGPLQKKNGSIVIYNARKAEIGRYDFSFAWPCSWKGPELVKDSNDPLTEEIELAVESIEKIK